MTAETLDTLRRDMTAAAASLADATRRADAAYDAMLSAALPIADAIAVGGLPSDAAVTAFRIRRESLAASEDAVAFAVAVAVAVGARLFSCERPSNQSADTFADSQIFLHNSAPGTGPPSRSYAQRDCA